MTADWVTLKVRMISPEILNTCSFSSQFALSSNSRPRVDASIEAAMSSANSPAYSSVCPYAWCSLKYPYVLLSAGMAHPIEDAISRRISFDASRAMTQNAMLPGAMSFTPSSFGMILHLGGKMLDTWTRLSFSMPASLSASSNERSSSRWLPTPFVKNTRVGTRLKPAFVRSATTVACGSTVAFAVEFVSVVRFILSVSSLTLGPYRLRARPDEESGSALSSRMVTTQRRVSRLATFAGKARATKRWILSRSPVMSTATVYRVSISLSSFAGPMTRTESGSTSGSPETTYPEAGRPTTRARPSRLRVALGAPARLTLRGPRTSVTETSRAG